jgi:RNA polymerase sigma-70 factor (ECF subfamily)
LTATVKKPAVHSNTSTQASISCRAKRKIGDQIREIEEAFHCALAALPENQRNAILMLQQQGLSYDEIAQALNASVSAIKTWIHRARTHLRQELKDFA